MVKKSTKSKSKRTTIRKKHKILQKVRAHDRKERRQKRKQAKENKASGIHLRRRPTLKDPGVPESWPFREDFLKEMTFEKNRILQEKKSKKSKSKDVEMKLDGVEELAKEATKQQESFESDTPLDQTHFEANIKDHFKDFRKVVALADVAICVLDARDPEGCRSSEVETLIRQSTPPKRLVFLLNKIDLVPRGIVESWLKHLRLQAPTIAFRSSTQKQRGNLGQAKTLESHGNLCLGADHLIQLLKNYTRNAKLRTAITVGLVGVPNVGKSSVINSLKRSRSAVVGNKPGVTTHVQEFHLDKQIRLLDSPGVIYEKQQSALQGVLKIESLSDPVGVVEGIVKKLESSKLSSIYQISDFTSAKEFLQLCATKMGKLKKGGIADIETTSKIVIQDWNNGKIPYYTTPPTPESAMDVQIVQQWAQDFNIDEIYQQNGLILESLNTDNDETMEAEKVEPISGGLEAFSKMAEISKTKATVREASKAFSEMKFDSVLEQISESSNPEEPPSDSVVKPTPQLNPQSGVKVLYRKGQKMSKRDKELYNEEGQYNPHRIKAKKKQFKKQKKRVKNLTELVAKDFQI